jgi:Acyl-CoA synthetase (NDP forming)
MIHPKSVAIIGASYDPNKVGHIVLRNYIHGGFSGKLYPVNVNAKDDLLGLKVYKSILDIKQEIDLVVIATPAATVPSLINECGKANAKGVVVISSGFAEVGNTDLQKQLIENAKKYNLAVIGPNCLGVMDLRSRTDTMYLPSFKLDKPIMGNVGFISQSGAIGSVVLDLIDHEGFGLSSFISYGNADVVDESDILNYLANDNGTKLIIFYWKGLKMAKDFFILLKNTG